MNCLTATGHVKTMPERRENAKGRTAAHFVVEIEDEVFPGRSRYNVACLDIVSFRSKANPFQLNPRTWHTRPGIRR
jgi:hypothetical protein